MRSSWVFLVSSLVAVAAKPLVAPQSRITLPLARYLNITGSAKLGDVDRASAKALIARTSLDAAKRAGSPIDAPLVSYFATSVGVGTPPTYYNLVLDTGSSNTWIGANAPYVKTSSSIDTDHEFGVSYLFGFGLGEQFQDTVTIGSLVIRNQGVGVASKAPGFNGIADGVLGVGPVDLTRGTLIPDGGDPIPTVTDNAYDQGFIPVNAVGVFFPPITSNPKDSGELTFGAPDESKLDSPLTYVPVTTTNSASDYWGIDATIYYGPQRILSTASGILDSGSMFIFLASDAYSAYQTATGATVDETTGLLTVTKDQYDNLENLSFVIGGEGFILTPNAQIWPRSLNTAIGGNPGSIYLIVASTGAPSGDGFDFMLGQPFLERFYSYYDTTNNRVGLAYTHFTFAETN